MTMRNRFAPHIDTTEIDGLIESNPRWGFSNLDLIAERRGNFLVQEWKQPGEDISEGQRILLLSLANQPRFTVLVVRGDQRDGVTTVQKVSRLTGGLDKAEVVGRTLDDLRTFVRAWYRECDNA
jgi:hypothetical protein